MNEERSNYGIVRRGGGGRTPRLQVFAFLSVFAILGWMYVFFISDAFVIREIETDGLSTLTSLDVSREVYRVLDARASWRPWSPRQGWFIDRDALTKELEERLFAESVTVDTISAHVLRLIVKERSKRVLLHVGTSFVWADRTGVVTDELTDLERVDVQARLSRKRFSSSRDPEIFLLPESTELTTGYVAVSTSTMRSWIALSDAFKSSGLNFMELRPPEATSTRVTVKTEEGYVVFLDTQIPLKTQVDAYRAFLKMKPLPKVSEYIDVRVPGKMYIK